MNWTGICANTSAHATRVGTFKSISSTRTLSTATSRFAATSCDLQEILQCCCFVCKNSKVASTFAKPTPLCWLHLTRVSHSLLHVLASRLSYYDMWLLLRLVEEPLVSQMLFFCWSSANSVADAENLSCHLICLCIGIQVPFLLL